MIRDVSIRTSGPASAKTGALVEQRVTEWVQSSGDVERAPGAGNHKWTQPECVGQTRRAADEYAVANIKGGAAIIFGRVVRIRRKIAGAARVAVRVVQSIVSKSGKLRAHSNAAVHDELVLPEDPVRLVLEDVALIRPRAQSVVCGIGRVDVVREKCVDAACIQVSYGEIRGLAELALHAQTCLHGVWRAQM